MSFPASKSATSKPSLHVVPLNPTLQLQIFGLLQFPLIQGLSHIAKIETNITTKCDFIVLSQVNEISLMFNNFHQPLAVNIFINGK